MKSTRLFVILILLSFVMSLQACGGGQKDTSGSLTMSDPTLTNNNDGTYLVKTTVTYTPPAGNTAQGVEVKITVFDSFGFGLSDTVTFTSGSNSLTYSFNVPQQPGVSNHLRIVSNIGDMSVSVVATIPAISPMSADPINFIAGDAVAPGTTKTSAITGGIGTYSLTSPSTVDGLLTISLSGSTLSVTYVTSSILPLATPATATVTVIDQANPVHTLSIPVTYFR